MVRVVWSVRMVLQVLGGSLAVAALCVPLRRRRSFGVLGVLRAPLPFWGPGCTVGTPSAVSLIERITEVLHTRASQAPLLLGQRLARVTHTG